MKEGSHYISLVSEIGPKKRIDLTFDLSRAEVHRIVSIFSTRTFKSGQTLRRGKNWFVPPHGLHITLPSLRAVSPPAGWASFHARTIQLGPGSMNQTACPIKTEKTHVSNMAFRTRKNLYCKIGQYDHEAASIAP